LSNNHDKLTTLRPIQSDLAHDIQLEPDVRPVRLDRLAPEWARWFLQTQKSAAAQALAQVENIKIQLALDTYTGPQQIAALNMQAAMLTQQAKTHTSVLALCEAATKGPYFTRDTLDEHLTAALETIDRSSRSDDVKKSMRSGIWEFCKRAGIPMPKTESGS